MEFYFVLGLIVLVFVALILGAYAMDVPIEITDTYNTSTNNAHMGEFNCNAVDKETNFLNPIFIKH